MAAEQLLIFTTVEAKPAATTDQMTCAICGRPFVPTHRQMKRARQRTHTGKMSCSPECRRKLLAAAKKPITRSCLSCSAVFTGPPHQFYCSEKCTVQRWERAKNSAAGLCQCGAPRDHPTFRSCVQCRAKWRRSRPSRAELDRSGLCIGCCKSPRPEGYKRCDECRKKDRLRRLLKIATGKCQCGSEPLEGRSRCARCIQAAYRGRLMRAMRLTFEDWMREFEEQGRRCACCGTDKPFVGETSATKRQYYDELSRWHTDHDHATKLFRGILCAKCNRTIGLLGDSIELIERRVVEILGYLTRVKRRQAAGAGTSASGCGGDEAVSAG